MIAVKNIPKFFFAAWKNFKFEYLFYIFLFLLPWQTRWIIHAGELNGGYWEYGTFSLYFTDLIFFITLVCFLYWDWKQRKSMRNIFCGESAPRGFSTPIWIVISLFESWIFLSLFWARDFSLGVYAYIRILEGIAFIFLLGHELINTKYLRFSLIGSALCQALFGIIQFFMQYVPASKWLGLSEHFASESGASVVATSTERWLRAYGSFPHPNIFGAFLVVGFLLLLPYYYESLERVRDRILLFSATLIFLLGILVAFSRSAWLGLVAGIFVFLCCKENTRKFTSRIYPLIIFLSLLFFVSFFRGPIFSRLNGTGPFEVRSREERLSQYEESLALILSRPLHGTGIGQYTLAVHDDIDATRESFAYQPAHNFYFLMASELGLIGLFLFTILILYPTALFQTRSPFFFMSSHYAVVGAVLFMGLFDHYLWSLQSGRWILFFAIGLLYQTEFLVRKRDELKAQKEALRREKFRLLKEIEKQKKI